MALILCNFNSYNNKMMVRIQDHDFEIDLSTFREMVANAVKDGADLWDSQFEFNIRFKNNRLPLKKMGCDKFRQVVEALKTGLDQYEFVLEQKGR